MDGFSLLAKNKKNLTEYYKTFNFKASLTCIKEAIPLKQFFDYYTTTVYRNVIPQWFQMGMPIVMRCGGFLVRLGGRSNTKIPIIIRQCQKVQEQI